MKVSRVIKAPRVLLQDLDGEAVLLNLANGHYYGLDEVSFRMYNLLITSSSVEAAYKRLIEEYDVSPAQLRADLSKFLKHMLAHGLVLDADSQVE